MNRLWEYLEARMPERGSRKRTVTCAFAVNTARMLIEAERKVPSAACVDKIEREQAYCRQRRDEKAGMRDAIGGAGWDGKVQGLEMALAILREPTTPARPGEPEEI
jgi:3-keto-L-gulonate-6-phosphate decarboxylase